MVRFNGPNEVIVRVMVNLVDKKSRPKEFQNYIDVLVD